jgi:MFS family permease
MVIAMLKGFRKPDHVAGSAAPAIMMSIFVSFGGILFGYDTGNINGLLAMRHWREQFSTGYIDPIDGKLNVSPSQAAQIVSILSAGTFFGSLSAAPLGDVLGRRPSLIMAMVIFSFGVILQVSAAHIPMLLAGRYVQAKPFCADGS